MSSYDNVADDAVYPEPLAPHPPAAPEPPPIADSFVPQSPSGPPRDVDMNGRVVTRGGSRRRKPVGGTGGSQMSPMAPDAPLTSNGPPISYRDSSSGQHSGSRTFADRARLLAEEGGQPLPSGNTPEPPPREDIPMHLPRHSRTESQYKTRHASQEAPRMPFGDGYEPARDSSHKRSRHSRTESAVEHHQNGAAIKAAPPVRTSTTRSNANPQKVDWAVDHSPLQRLENDTLSRAKAEKRARVMQAEQRAREKEKARKERESKGSDALLSPDRAAFPVEPKRTSKRESTTVRGLEEIGALSKANQERAERATELAERAKVERRVVSEPQAAAARPADNRTSRIPRPVDIMTSHGIGPTVTPRSASYGARTSLDSAVARRASEAANTLSAQQAASTGRRRSVDDRGVRFPQNPVEASASTSQPGPNEPLKITPQTSARVSDSSFNKNSAIVGGAGAVAGAAVGAAAHTSTHKGVKYELPPQTAAGGKARQLVGFGGIANEQALGSAGTKHHFPHFHKQVADAPISQQPIRYLDEWRQGTTARLLLSDETAQVVTKNIGGGKQLAWWETPPSQRRSNSISQQQTDVAYFDGANEDINREYKPDRSERVRFSFAEERRPERGDDEMLREGVRMSPVRDRREQIVTLKYLFRQQSALEAILARSGSFDLCLAPLSPEYLRMPYLSDSLTSFPFPSEPTKYDPPLYVKCGPLLRYTGIKREKLEGAQGEAEIWRGSVMIVTIDSESTYTTVPTLRLFHQHMDLLPPPPAQIAEGEEPLPSEYVDPVAGLPKIARDGSTIYVKPAEDFDDGVDYSHDETDGGLFEKMRTANVPTSYGRPDDLVSSSPVERQRGPASRKAKTTGRFREVKGIRLHAERDVTFWRFNIEVELGEKQSRIAYRINKGASVGFWVPGRGQTMNMMFHSCNGFSSSVDSNEFSGPDPLWRDVLNAHQTKPFHVMLGGGDQIYNDKVSDATTIFKAWLETKNPLVKRQAEFTPELRDELETFYLDRYSMWFSHGLFSLANAQIPMVNIWDDHDIIDGFGSYSHSFMSTPIFCGLGNVAFKYYMLFQHQSVPDELEADEPSWLLGAGPGPYINFQSRSVFLSLGKNVSFLGLDCRTERMRDEILSEQTYDLVFDRCRREIIHGQTKHLIVLLGVPIAYPRLVWLENILTSRAMDPVKALGRLGMFGNLMNKFDGGYEILDDLDDHWTASHHKAERRYFIEELQDLAAEKSVRITILSGDVHLAAIGQFYSNKKLQIPKDRDHRYMPNVISSAIVNTPPPDMMADMLNRRDKLHHLDHETDEDMIQMFLHDVDGKKRNNKTLLPRRNWCSISEYQPGSTPPPTPPFTPTPPDTPMSEGSDRPAPRRSLSLTRDIRPGNLLRRLSLSNKPRHADEDSLAGDDLEKDSYFPPASGNARVFNQLHRNVSAPPLPTRPLSQFHRRPTDLSEKAAKKGGADVHDDYISLEHGLDIRLNCEIKKGDPLGSTESYRLLVPALYYIEDAPPPVMQRRNSLLERVSSLRAGPFTRKKNRGSVSTLASQDGPIGPDVTRGAMRAPAQVQPHVDPPTGYSVSVESLNAQPQRRNSLLQRLGSLRDKVPQIGKSRRASNDFSQNGNDEFSPNDDAAMMRNGRKSLPSRPPISGSADQVFYRPRRQSFAERVSGIGRRLSQKVRPQKQEYYSDDEYFEGSMTGSETESEDEHPEDYIGSGDLTRPGRQPSGSHQPAPKPTVVHQPRQPAATPAPQPAPQPQKRAAQPAATTRSVSAKEEPFDPFKPRPKVAMSPPPQAQHAQAQHAHAYGSTDAMISGNGGSSVQRTRSGRAPPQDNRRSGAVFRQPDEDASDEDMSEDDTEGDEADDGDDGIGGMDSIDDLDSLKQVPHHRRKNMAQMLGDDGAAVAEMASPTAGGAGTGAGSAGGMVPRRKDMSKFFGGDVPAAGNARRHELGDGGHHQRRSAGADAGAGYAKRDSRGWDGVDAYNAGESKKWWKRMSR